MGILVPAQSGSTWTTSPSTPFLIAWVTLGLVVSMTADSFAGERERHTLETLLARASLVHHLSGTVCGEKRGSQRGTLRRYAS